MRARYEVGIDLCGKFFACPCVGVAEVKFHCMPVVGLPITGHPIGCRFDGGECVQIVGLEFGDGEGVAAFGGTHMS